MGADFRRRGRQLPHLHDRRAVFASVEALGPATYGVRGLGRGRLCRGRDTAISRPERIAQRLFGLRAEGLLSGLAPQTARARLSGLLIGLELAGAKPYWLGQNVAILGEGTLASAYAAALATLGVPATRIAADPATRAGLVAAWRNLTGAET